MTAKRKIADNVSKIYYSGILNKNFKDLEKIIRPKSEKKIVTSFTDKLEKKVL